jgi:hypothetical protein
MKLTDYYNYVNHIIIDDFDDIRYLEELNRIVHADLINDETLDLHCVIAANIVEPEGPTYYNGDLVCSGDTGGCIDTTIYYIKDQKLIDISQYLMDYCIEDLEEKCFNHYIGG